MPRHTYAIRAILNNALHQLIHGRSIYTERTIKITRRIIIPQFFQHMWTRFHPFCHHYRRRFLRVKYGYPRRISQPLMGCSVICKIVAIIFGGWNWRNKIAFIGIVAKKTRIKSKHLRIIQTSLYCLYYFVKSVITMKSLSNRVGINRSNIYRPSWGQTTTLDNIQFFVDWD